MKPVADCIKCSLVRARLCEKLTEYCFCGYEEVVAAAGAAREMARFDGLA